MLGCLLITQGSEEIKSDEPEIPQGFSDALPRFPCDSREQTEVDCFVLYSCFLTLRHAGGR